MSEGKAPVSRFSIEIQFGNPAHADDFLFKNSGAEFGVWSQRIYWCPQGCIDNINKGKKSAIATTKKIDRESLYTGTVIKTKEVSHESFSEQSIGGSTKASHNNGPKPPQVLSIGTRDLPRTLRS